MGILKKIFSKGISEVIDSAGNLVDRFSLTKQEKQEFKLEMQSRLLKLETELEETYREELEDRKEVIKAELAQGDLYTKRARPSIIYAGIIFIFLIYVLIPLIAYMVGTPPDKMPSIDLPEEFWWAWGTVVGVYGVGRSAEKFGVINKKTNLVTGSGAEKVDRKNAEG